MNTQQTKNLHRLLWLANVQQFFPDKAPEQLWKDYTSWLKNRNQFQRLYKRYPLHQLPDFGPLPMDIQPAGSILISFHYGPYRLLPKFLVKCGYQITLLAAASILEREAEYYDAELRNAGLSSEMLQCIDANNSYSLRKILSAVKEKRLVLVFMDANEGQRIDHSDSNKLPVPFAAHYFCWRTNILKLATRFRIPVYCTYMERCKEEIPWAVHPFVPILTDTKQPTAAEMMHAFSGLQLSFQQMMNQGWIYWENWAFIHQYNGDKANTSRGIAASGSWVLPLEYQQQKYLFDIRNRQFFQIKS